MMASAIAVVTYAEDIQVKTFRYAGPFEVREPVMVDTMDVHSRPYLGGGLLDTPVNLELAAQGKVVNDGLAPHSSYPYALHLLQFDVRNTTYKTFGIEVKGLQDYKVFVDGKPMFGTNTTLPPNTHRVVIKYLSEQDRKDSLKVRIKNADSTITVDTSNRRVITLSDIQNGSQYAGVSLSADGRYLISNIYTVLDGGSTQRLWRITDLKTNKILTESKDPLEWLPNSNSYYVIRKGNNGRDIVVTNVHTNQTSVLAQGVGEGTITVSPTKDYLILTTDVDGPREDIDVYEVLVPDDRQPNWRTRTQLSVFDCKTGVSYPLTFGFRNIALQDISQDGRYALISTTQRRLEKRPTRLSSLYLLDVKNMSLEPVIEDEGFLSNAIFSPDGKQLLVKASAEAFGGIGRNLPEGLFPNMYDYQLYIVDIATKQPKPLTKHFNPSIERYVWNALDKQIYFTALDKDAKAFFSLNPKNGKIRRYDMPEDMVTSMSFAAQAPVMAWHGESVSNSDRLYSMPLKTAKSVLVEDLGKDKLKDITLGECKAWNFVSSRGDTINGRFYLPPHFDATKKYPLIVNYYGGCLPVSRNFESRYPHHVYAAQGYVVYVVNPSGAAGFGQEFGSRHVNTAGKGVAEDIIEGTKKFVAEHSYVDGTKIGCIGASYGGFMTQYLQTQTDIFAAAISHAGISDHTSYWGEGFWGYSYSEVSMAESYPWTRKDLYVEQSPLYNADKIHTPILFLHGSQDNNVPVGESIQMFTALKLLGRETALVIVNGEDHQINDYRKRQKWQNTIFAWFEKYLKTNKAWWQDLYSEKNL